MFFTIVSPKYQGTFGVEVRRELGIKPGTRMMGTVENGKVIFEPVKDVMDAFGSMKKYKLACTLSNKEETEIAERSIAADAMKSMGHDWSENQ